MTSGDHEEHNDDDHSPESAGLARGLARSAAGRGASRAALGRLPARARGAATSVPVHVTSAGSSSIGSGAAKASKAASRQRFVRAPAHRSIGRSTGVSVKGGKIPVRAGRVGGGGSSTTSASRVVNKVKTRTSTSSRVNVRRVAKASDRASTGLDLVEAATSDGQGLSETERLGKWKAALKRLPAFATALVKNTLLGMAVFSTYEELIDEDDSPIDEFGHSPFANHDTPTLERHFGAGFLAGCVHAGFSYVMDGLASWRQQIIAATTQGTGTRASSMLQTLRGGMSPFFPSMMHHATSHCVLFGTFEGTKRLLVDNTMGTTCKNGPQHGEKDEEDHATDLWHLSAVGIAGGIASSAQFVVGEYTERLLKLAPCTGNNSACNTQNSMAFSSSQRHYLSQRSLKLRTIPTPRIPNIQSLLFAFIPSSIGFVAFEYGKALSFDDDV